MNRHEIIQVPGVPQTVLSEQQLALLPASAPPAPWECHASSVMWRTGASKGIRSFLPASLQKSKPHSVVCGFVNYTDTPVGVYNEVFGNIAYLRGLRSRANVAFMAVDLPESLVGGRLNWSMPKTLAEFSGQVKSDSELKASGDGWAVELTVKSFGPQIPFAVKAKVEQEFYDGSLRVCTLKTKGRGRLALIKVEATGSDGFNSWFKSGWRLGLKADSLSFTLSKPK